ncbi:hypothetical protein [Nitrosomonas oligotropha]|uniref:SipW-cognate class signal peptide n=1 Tax=Nitrosomonas oligotropha TaxID=42354 RepID=A0A1H8K8Y2_9PROT|nr:hypothetical protein [Nitrosomonas oligotropha]SDW28646.1 SipW-cognate class signal peptide [Nitrosomonas oligotropha]SEN89315.1 SipW-cognate class signal peptide [Nitrosomonas oligotropha]
MSYIDSITETLVREWVKLYKEHPKLTVTITIVLGIVGGTVAYFTEQHNQEVREARRLENLDYANQVRSLDETRKNLNALIEFVDSQKQQLETSHQALQAIKSEHERMKPLLESDREVIDAIFAAQETRNQSAQSTERWIGFGLGVVASLIASFLWAAITYALRRNQSSSSV